MAKLNSENKKYALVKEKSFEAPELYVFVDNNFQEILLRSGRGKMFGIQIRRLPRERQQL